MARTRQLAPYPDPSPQLYDTQVERLVEQDHRDAYDKSFRIDQRFRRWGIEIADIINALDIGGWDPSSKVVFVGDGEDADYTTINEALIAVSPSSFDPRVIIVFPGTYFERLYVPSHTTIMGIGERGSVKIRCECGDGEIAVGGGTNDIHFVNLDVKQTNAGAANTAVMDFAAMDVSFKDIILENLGTAASNEVLVFDEISYTQSKRVRLEDVHLKGHNSAVAADAYVHFSGTAAGLWPSNHFTNTGPANAPDQSGNSWDLVGRSDATLDATGGPWTDGCIACATYNACYGNTSIIPDDTHEVTAEIWIKPASYNYTTNIIMSSQLGNHGWYVFVNTSGVIYISYWKDDGAGGSTLINQINTGISLTSAWQLIGVTLDPDDYGMRVFRNGELIGEMTLPGITLPYGSGAAGANCHFCMGHDTSVTYGNDSGMTGWYADARILFESKTIGWMSHPGEKARTSTLRIASGSTNLPSEIELRNVVVQNDDVNFNINIGNADFRLRNVSSEVSRDSAGVNIQIANDQNDCSTYLFEAVSMLGGDPLSLFGYNAKATIGPGVYATAPFDDISKIEKTYAASPMGQVVGDEFFHQRLGDTWNALYDEVDAGAVMPEPDMKWFPNIGVDGNIKADDITAHEAIEAAWALAETPGYVQMDDYDIEGFIYPYT